MSMLDPHKLRQELLLKQGMNQQLDNLVRRASTTVALLKNNSRMEESQLRNLLNVAIESPSVEVVINFIRYQIARSSSAWGTGPNDFGHQVIADIRQTVKTCAEQAVQYVTENMEAATMDETLHAEAYVRLMQLYLGYLQRAFYYGKKTEDFQALTEVSNAQ